MVLQNAHPDEAPQNPKHNQPSTTKPTIVEIDTIIVGAGLSGIGTACYLEQKCQGKAGDLTNAPHTYAILERRAEIGGTWDLFKYPGIRSDSDMLTFGYEFRPWNEPVTLASGPAIKQYVTDTANEYGVTPKIHFNTDVQHSSWNSSLNRWQVTTQQLNKHGQSATVVYHCKFLVLCAGYYNYSQGYTPQFNGIDTYKGQVIHPQHWPDTLDYTSKNVVVIGSGATAVTIVPAMADKTASITMLQRSPSYIMSLPAIDPVTNFLNRFLPNQWVYRWARKRNIRMQRWIYAWSKRWPQTIRKLLIWSAKRHLGKDFDISHFSPEYAPWDQRLCVVPDADLFKALKSKKAGIVTDEIDTFTAEGIKLKSGQLLHTDIVITATGLNLGTTGGMSIDIDGEARNINEVMVYKGALVQDVPNLVYVFGSTNSPWTLKACLSGQYFCRLVNYMQEHDYNKFVAVNNDPTMPLEESVMGSLTSGYVQRGEQHLPRQGREDPWRVHNHYQREHDLMLNTDIDDGILTFE